MARSKEQGAHSAELNMIIWRAHVLRPGLGGCLPSSLSQCIVTVHNTSQAQQRTARDLAVMGLPGYPQPNSQEITIPQARTEGRLALDVRVKVYGAEEKDSKIRDLWPLSKGRDRPTSGPRMHGSILVRVCDGRVACSTWGA